MSAPIDPVGSLAAAAALDLPPSGAQSPPPAIPSSSADPQPAPQPTQARQPDAQAVRAAIARITEQLPMASRVLEFSIDAPSGLTVVTVRDQETGNVIRQIPSEEIVHLADMLSSGKHGASALLSLTA